MAETEKFYEPEIDRTNYQAFWYVGLASVVLVGGSAYGLYVLGNRLRHLAVPSLPAITLPTLPTISTPDPKAALNAAENQANQDAQQAASKAADQAASKATDNMQSKLNQFLKP